MVRRRVPMLLAALWWSSIAHAAPNPWAFELDTNLSEDPAYTNARLAELQAGLPGLPTNAGIVELVTGPVKLYFFDEISAMLTRAEVIGDQLRGSGPSILPAVAREPTICIRHDSFTRPDLGTVGSPACELSEGAVMAPLSASKVKTCMYTEFPESYVYDHPIDLDANFFSLIPTVSHWSTLVGLIGESLRYLDYPEGLLPEDFILTMRNILAKLRYEQLKGQIATQIEGYQDSMAKAQGDLGCYSAASVNSLVTTLTAMIAELQAVERHLDGIYQEGVARAAADRKAVENQGRLRVELPYPALTDQDRELLALYVAGITWRMRGGGLVKLPQGQSSLEIRALYVRYPFGLIAELAGGADNAPAMAFDIFIDANWGYAEWYDMGTDPVTRDKYSDLVEMTNRGKRLTALVAPRIAALGYDIKPLVAGGLQMGPCYYYIWEELNELVFNPAPQLLGFSLGADLGDYSRYPRHVQPFLHWPTATGEVCTGGALALGLVRTLLWGKAGGTVCSPDCTGKRCGVDDGCGTPCSATCPSNDAGPSLDAAAQVDSGVVPSEETVDDGCSCRAGHRDQGPTSALFCALVVVLLRLRRRCRRAGRSL